MLDILVYIFGYMIRPGITGLIGVQSQDLIELVQLKNFKAACYDIAQNHNLQVENIEPLSVTPNFHKAYFTGRDLETWAVCNGNLPIVAFTKSFENWFQQGFIDLPKIGATFSTLGYQVATAKELQKDFLRKDWILLDDLEIKAIKYWQPQIVGQVIFNWFD